MIESVAVTLEGADPSAPGYLNGVALVDTTLAPSVLLAMLHAIEHRHGRERAQRWGSRTLDLDLIAYADVRSEAPDALRHARDAEEIRAAATVYIIAHCASLLPSCSYIICSQTGG